CNKRRIVVNCADVPECCDFHIPTTVRDGPVQISVSTSGFAPGLSRRIKKSLVASLDPSTGQAVTSCGKLREKRKIMGVERTRRIKFMSDAQKKWNMLQWARMKENEVEDVAGKVARGEDVAPPA
ncbi:siroheme synthase middle domains-like protein, partial [Gonapodya prolifera JEL478]